MGIQGSDRRLQFGRFATATLEAFSAPYLARQINGTDWTQHGPVALSAVADGNQLTITAVPGVNGSAASMYELHTDSNLCFSPAPLPAAPGPARPLAAPSTT